jgi:predicted alpha-1,2-mannosidase
VRRLSLLVLPLLPLLGCSNDSGSGGADVDTNPGTDVDTSDIAADAEPDALDAAVDTSDAAEALDTAEDATDVADAEPDAEPAPEPLTLEEAHARVDPFYGSGGIGFGYASGTPAAQMPNGFVKVGPDTTAGGAHAPQNHFSGYYYLDPHVRGFSHIRLVGTGAADLGNLRFTPLAEADDEPWRSWTALDKETEEAAPGYYRCDLPTEGVTAEMTSGWFSAIHRYAYDAGAVLQIDPASSIVGEGVELASIAWDGSEVQGEVEFDGPFTGRSRGFTLSFSITFDVEPDSVSGWDNDGLVDGTEFDGTRTGMVFTFPEGSTVEARVGLSLIGVAEASANRVGEAGPDQTLEGLRAEASTAWDGVVGNVQIAGGTLREQRIFYSSLYNAYRMPTRLSEPDGRYRGFDGEVHTADGHDYVSDLSMWDTYRTLHPWYSLTDQPRQRDALRSLLLMDEQGGDGVPRWPAMLGETGSMIGESADIVFGDAAAKGVEGIDWGDAFEALYRNSYERTYSDDGTGLGREGIEDYVTLGYLPYERYDESVSKTLEYVWNDFGLASVARAAGETEMAAELEERSLSFTNTIRPEHGFPWPRDAAGEFDPDTSERSVYMRGGPFTEGSAWHWRFYGWHAPEVLAEMVGGDVALREALERFFADSRLGEEGRPNNALPDPFYWHGNEPALHAAALFVAAGDANRGTHWAREIMERLYNDTPDGIPGNDDGGTLSSWYLFTSIGMYPVAGSNLYYLTAPLFEEVRVDLGDGETLTLLAPGASHENREIVGVTLNGDPMDSFEIRHGQLAGATIEFELVEPQ